MGRGGDGSCVPGARSPAWVAAVPRRGCPLSPASPVAPVVAAGGQEGQGQDHLGRWLNASPLVAMLPAWSCPATLSAACSWDKAGRDPTTQIPSILRRKQEHLCLFLGWWAEREPWPHPAALHCISSLKTPQQPPGCPVPCVPLALRPKGQGAAALCMPAQ